MPAFSTKNRIARTHNLMRAPAVLAGLRSFERGTRVPCLCCTGAPPPLPPISSPVICCQRRTSCRMHSVLIFVSTDNGEGAGLQHMSVSIGHGVENEEHDRGYATPSRAAFISLLHHTQGQYQAFLGACSDRSRPPVIDDSDHNFFNRQRSR